jgi:hypothetical protein
VFLTFQDHDANLILASVNPKASEVSLVDVLDLGKCRVC